MKKLIVLFILFLATAANATTYNWYFSQDGNDSLPNDGSIGAPWQSLTKVDSQIASLTTGDVGNIFLRGGDTWTLTSNADCLAINKSNVTIDQYGTGKAIIDGANAWPDNTDGYIVDVGNATTPSATITGVYIKNLIIQNLGNGGGIIFKGTSTIPNKGFVGPGSVEYCEFYRLGWTAAKIYGVPNNAGSAYAVKIEYNILNGINDYARESGSYWPQGIDTNNGWTYGHECRYNTVSDVHGEGIGATGFSIIEYNVVSDCKAPFIYSGYVRNSGTGNNSVVRYNLLWHNSAGRHIGTVTTTGIRLDNENSASVNSSVIKEFYGNIIVGMTAAGIDLRNRDNWSHWGSVKVYNNTLIDNKTNYYITQPDEFNAVDVRNNISIIDSDTPTAYSHVTAFGTVWTSWAVGPNYWIGDSWALESDMKNYIGGADLPSQWKIGTNVFGGATSPISKYSGWGALTSIPTFGNFYPIDTSTAIDRSETDVIASYATYLTNGSEFSTNTYVTAAQGDEGADWDFGAVIRDVTSPITYTIITTLLTPEYGSIDCDPIHSEEEGGDHTITVTPINDSYGVTAMKVDGVWTATKSLTVTFTDITADHSVEIVMQRIPSVTGMD